MDYGEPDLLFLVSIYILLYTVGQKHGHLEIKLEENIYISSFIPWYTLFYFSIILKGIIWHKLMYYILQFAKGYFEIV